MKTLAMIKMEKNFIAVLEKGYPRKPYETYNLDFLLKRLFEEVMELKDMVDRGYYDCAKAECGDVSNIVDYIFEKLSNEEAKS